MWQRCSGRRGPANVVVAALFAGEHRCGNAVLGSGRRRTWLWQRCSARRGPTDVSSAGQQCGTPGIGSPPLRELTRLGKGAARNYFALVIADSSAASVQQLLEQCACATGSEQRSARRHARVRSQLSQLNRYPIPGSVSR